jgi:anti-sigma B factor antagonist
MTPTRGASSEREWWVAVGISLAGGHPLLDGTSVVSVAGELDAYTAALFEQELRATLNDGVEAVVVDLTKCDFIDSTALGVLVGAHKRFGKSNGAFSLVTADSHTRKVLGITGLDRVFAIHPTRAAALNGGLVAREPRLLSG